MSSPTATRARPKRRQASVVRRVREGRFRSSSARERRRQAPAPDHPPRPPSGRRAGFQGFRPEPLPAFPHALQRAGPPARLRRRAVSPASRDAARFPPAAVPPRRGGQQTALHLTQRPARRFGSRLRYALFGLRSAKAQQALADFAQFLFQPVDPLCRSPDDDEENADQDQRQQFEHASSQLAKRGDKLTFFWRRKSVERHALVSWSADADMGEDKGASASLLQSGRKLSKSRLPAAAGFLWHLLCSN